MPRKTLPPLAPTVPTAIKSHDEAKLGDGGELAGGEASDLGRRRLGAKKLTPAVEVATFASGCFVGEKSAIR